MADDLAIQRLADRLDEGLRKTFLAVVAAIAAGPNTDELDELVERGDVLGIIRLWEETLRTTLQTSVVKFEGQIASVVGQAATITVAQFAGSLQRTSNLALEWIHNEAASLVVGIQTDTMLAIREMLRGGYVAGTGVRVTGRQLRSVVGLLPSHARAVRNYADELLARGFPAARIEQFTTIYASRLLAYRAENIARTETMMAAHAGQVAGWRAMVEAGILQNHRTWMQWVVTDDDRLCPLCAPMDGKKVRIGEGFTSDTKGFPEGYPDVETPGSRRLRKRPLKPDPLSQKRKVDRKSRNKILDGKEVRLPIVKTVFSPPLHPSCRCTLRLAFADATVQ